MNVGREWLVDAAGCDPELLRSPVALRSLCARIIDDLELRVVGGGHVHQFPFPGGVTALYLLTESHLACHTYPEHGVATFNLHCCRIRPDWPWETELHRALGAKRVVVRRLERGATEVGGDLELLAATRIEGVAT
jgi:S-adenosylmethionine decarboxylase